jgi:hypothetical protein
VFKIKQQNEMTTKLILVVIGLTSVSAILVPTYAVPTIRSADIFDGEVKTADIANNAVTSPKIQNGQVNTDDLASNAVTAAKIADGTIQEQDIADGVIPSSGGSTGQLVVTERSQTFGPVGAPSNADISVDCNSDEIATGGGFGDFGVNDHVVLRESKAGSPAGNGWHVALDLISFNSGTREVTVYAECAKIVP